jgi:G3E family GTPase
LADAVSTTLLTGFLGAGKTTLLNRILTTSHGRRVGVLVNEFGELGIDAALVEGADSVIELATGCICCATRGDFVRAVQAVLTASATVETLLIETSGLADPEPLLADLERISFGRVARLDGVVTVIDAENFDRNLDDADVAFQQIVCGDILLVNKVDLVPPAVPDLIEAGLRRLNPRARVAHTVRCDAPLDVVLGPARVGRVANGRPHHVHDGFVSVSLTVDAPLDAERFSAWLDELPVDAFRVKGLLRLDVQSDTLVVQCVGERRSVTPAPAGVDVTGAALVLIGRDLDAAALRATLGACRA